MKRRTHRTYIVLLAIIALLYLFPLFLPGVPKTHDGELHTARFAAYTKAFEADHVPPRWAHDLNYSYGTPLFNFYYPLPGYIGSGLHALGLSFQGSFEVFLSLTFILAPIAFYLWMKELVSKEAAFGAALVYGLAPYHFLDHFVRGSVSESLAFVFIPLVPLFIERIRKDPSLPHILLGGVSYGLLILSHNIMSLLFSFLYLLYALIRLRTSVKELVSGAVVFVTGLTVSAYFWLPAILEQKYTHSSLLIGKKYLDNFPTFSQLIYAPWGTGTAVTEPGGLSPMIGPLHLILALVSIFYLREDSKHRWMIVAGIMLLIASIFFALDVSAPLWPLIPFLTKIEFPWRFIAIASVAVAMISGAVFEKLSRRTVVSIIAVLLLSSIPFTRVDSYEPEKADAYYQNFGPSTDYGAVTPIWTAGDPYEYPESPVSIVAGDGNISDYIRTPLEHRMTVHADTEVTVLDNTLFYPGWLVTVDGKETPIQFQDPNHRGLITFSVPEGTHAVVVRLIETRTRKVANLASLVSSIAIIGLGVYSMLRRKLAT